MSEADSKSARPAAAEASQVKETIESILVAFILAFIFRAFVVEAFVIPTGSMAPTLLGAHFHFVCPDCGYAFDVNYSDPNEDSEDISIKPDGLPSADVYCPNCGYQVASKTGHNLPVHYGDRILVLKYVYLLHDPRRWDVVVFKSPDKPQDFHYTQNYIKRLAGLPGERIMVLDGDLYAATGDQAWQIQRKPRSAQEAMWRLVYDNDYLPQGLSRDSQGFSGINNHWIEPWSPDAVAGAGWDTGGAAGARTFHFNNPGATGVLNFNADANPTTQTMSDYLVYDADSHPNSGYANRTPTRRNDDRATPINDVKLAVYYQRTSGDGGLRLKLSRYEKHDHVFTAEILPDKIRLLEQVDELKPKEVEEVSLAKLGISPGEKIFAEFMDVDYEVTLRINGRNAFDPYDYSPDVGWLLDQWRSNLRHRAAEVHIEAEQQTCTLDHIGVWRDVYYTDHVSPGDGGPPNGTPDRPIQLGPAEYFCLGDNSAVSEDGRYWTQPINLPQEGLVNVAPGRVPAQFMLGQAVFVYWPAGFAPSWLPSWARVPVVPNFGEMRWIH